MTDAPNPEDLARLYMEFWQKHLAGLTRDPQVAESIARLFDLMTAGASSFAQMMAQAGSAKPGETKSRARGAADEAARIEQLTRRVAELERRIARLEPRARTRRAGQPTRPRRRPR